MADVKSTVADYRSKAEDVLNKAKSTASQSSAEVSKVAKEAFAELRSTVEQLASAVKGNAQQQVEAVKAGGDFKAQLEAQKSLASNYVEPLKAAGNSVSNIAVSLKDGLVAVAK